MLACWFLVTRRLLRRRIGLLVAIGLAISLPTAAAVLAAVVSASASPASGELNSRLLSGAAARVQVDDGAAADAITELARTRGESPVREFLSTPVVVMAEHAAVSVQLQIGEQLPADPDSRLQLLAGGWPAGAGEACLTEAVANVAGVGVGDRVSTRAGARADPSRHQGDGCCHPLPRVHRATVDRPGSDR